MRHNPRCSPLAFFLFSLHGVCAVRDQPMNNLR